MQDISLRSHKILRLVKGSHKSHVQGLFVMMHLKDLTMNDIQSATGISRQTLSKWRKGANVTHLNVSKVCSTYDLDIAEIYNADLYIKNEIDRTQEGYEKAMLQEFHSEFKYLMDNAFQIEKVN